MEQFHNDDLEYVVDDYFDEFYDDDNPFSDVESPGSTDVESVDSDFEDDFESVRLQCAFYLSRSLGDINNRRVMWILILLC